MLLSTVEASILIVFCEIFLMVELKSPFFNFHRLWAKFLENKHISDQLLLNLMIATIRATRINTNTTSIQNLCGFRIFSTIPFSCLLERKMSSFTLSTYCVNSTILSSDYLINSPVIFKPYFQRFIPPKTYYISRSIYSSTFFHSFIFASSI